MAVFCYANMVRLSKLQTGGFMKIDDDVKEMNIQQLRREVMKLRRAFRKELKSTGNRRCWINLLEALPENQCIKPLSIPRAQFLTNCGRYYDRNQK